MYVEINDNLIEHINKLARMRGFSLQEGLEKAVIDFITKEEKTFHLRKASFKGEGLQSNLSDAEIKEMIYQGHIQ